MAERTTCSSRIRGILKVSRGTAKVRTALSRPRTWSKRSMVAKIWKPRPISFSGTVKCSTADRYKIPKFKCIPSFFRRPAAPGHFSKGPYLNFWLHDTFSTLLIQNFGGPLFTLSLFAYAKSRPEHFRNSWGTGWGPSGGLLGGAMHHQHPR